MEQLTRWTSGTILSAARAIESKLSGPRDRQGSLSSSNDRKDDPRAGPADQLHRSKTAPEFRRAKRRNWGLSSLYDSTINSLSGMSPDMVDSYSFRQAHPDNRITFRDDSSTLSGETLHASSEAWIVDSDADSHMTSCQSSFLSLRQFGTAPYPLKDNSQTADSAELIAAGVGTVLVTLANNRKILLSNVYYVPRLRRSRLSLRQLQSQGLSIRPQETEVEICCGNEKIASALGTDETPTLLATKVVQDGSVDMDSYFGCLVRYVQPVRDHRRRVISSKLRKAILSNYDFSTGRYELWDVVEKRMVLTSNVILLDDQLRKFDWRPHMDAVWGTMF